MTADSAEGCGETGRLIVELAEVIAGEAIEEAFAFRGEAKENAAAVGGVRGAAQEALVLGAVRELDDAVVAKAEALGGVGNGGRGAVGGTGDLEQELMLLGMEADGGGGGFAEVEEAAELEAEVGEGGEQGVGAQRD